VPPSNVDNVNIDASHDLGDVLEKYSSGDEINVIYQRAGVENSINIKLQYVNSNQKNDLIIKL